MVFYIGYQSYRRKKNKKHAVAHVGVNSLMNFINISYDPNNWRLFIHSSKLSLKTVLLYNGTLLLSISIGHFVNVKETYANAKLLLVLIKFKNHKWHICGDLEVISLFMGISLTTPNTAVSCICVTVVMESHTTYKTNVCLEIWNLVREMPLMIL